MKATRSLHQFWNSKWLLAIAAGILLGFSFPPFPLAFLQFPAFIFIFRLIAISSSGKEAAYYSYAGFLIWNLIGTYWLMLASLPAGIAANLANAVLMALIVRLMYQAQEKISNAWGIALIQSAFWVSFEYLHHHWDLTWPWLSLGNAWSSFPALVQYISATGFLGISSWVIICSALFFQGLQRHSSRLRITAALIFIIMPLISLLQWATFSSNDSQTVETVIAQPNFNAYQELDNQTADQQTFDLQKQLSDSVRTPRTKLVLWPENGLHPYFTNRRAANFMVRRVRSELKKLANRWHSTIVGGVPFIQYYGKKQHPSLPHISGAERYLTFNAAVGFTPQGHFKVYKKHNLVPVIERFPFVLFFNAIDRFGWIDWAAIQQFGEGRRFNMFPAGATNIPVLICYDSVYPGWVRNFVKSGAGFITIITNDGWWGNTSGHVQHFDYARLRAIEFRRWVIQDSNNGTSGVIAPNGSVRKRTAFGTRTAFRYAMPIRTDQTFYTRFGDWLPITLLFFSAGAMLQFILMYIRKTR